MPRPDVVGPAILAALAEHGPLTSQEVADRTGRPFWSVEASLRYRLVLRGQVERIEGTRPLQYRLPSRRPASGEHRLPMFVAGPGDRDETCRFYAGCLDRWVRRSQSAAHCPADCADRTAIDPRRERDHLATSRPGAMSTGGH